MLCVQLRLRAVGRLRVETMAARAGQLVLLPYRRATRKNDRGQPRSDFSSRALGWSHKASGAAFAPQYDSFSEGLGPKLNVVAVETYWFTPVSFECPA